MALGADRGKVLKLILASALLQVGIGLAIGIPVALLGGHLWEASSTVSTPMTR